MSTLEPSVSPLEPEQRIGKVLRERWRVDELVWTTPASSLYWATHRTGTRAAIRILSPELSANAARCALFLNTASTVQRIGHDGAVRILDDDTDQDGSVFLVLELFDATSLRSALDAAQGPMDLDLALRVGHGMLDVLAAAHRAGVQHGALRAEDVFVTRQGHLKLLGFEGMPLDHGLNFQRDTSAVGALLYTMLAGAPPRGHGLGGARPDLPVELADVVDRALGLGAGEPWADAGAMLAALTAARQVSRDTIETTAPTPQPTRPAFVAFHPERAGGEGATAADEVDARHALQAMNPLFVEGGQSVRPAAAAHTSWRRNAGATLARLRRSRWLVATVVLGAAAICAAAAFAMSHP